MLLRDTDSIDATHTHDPHISIHSHALTDEIDLRLYACEVFINGTGAKWTAKKRYRCQWIEFYDLFLIGSSFRIYFISRGTGLKYEWSDNATLAHYFFMCLGCSFISLFPTLFFNLHCQPQRKSVRVNGCWVGENFKESHYTYRNTHMAHSTQMNSFTWIGCMNEFEYVHCRHCVSVLFFAPIRVFHKQTHNN